MFQGAVQGEQRTLKLPWKWKIIPIGFLLECSLTLNNRNVGFNDFIQATHDIAHAHEEEEEEVGKKTNE